MYKLSSVGESNVKGSWANWNVEHIKSLDHEDNTQAAWFNLAFNFAKSVKADEVPAVVGRTKSGGAHVWVFLTEPVEAADMQRRMTELAAALGYSGSEIFPKQTTILLDRGDTGNFLNMPYHSSKNSTRYAFDDE
eukprot:gene4505-11545_t